MTLAVLIIDVQLGNFVGSTPIFQGDVLLNNSKLILQEARKTGIRVIYIQNMGGKGDPDEPGSDGWEIHSIIKPLDNESIFQKTTPDSFHETGLDEFLKSVAVKNLIILGLQTEYCIDTTIRRAYGLGYNVSLVKDCHSTWDSGELSALQIINHHNNVLGGFFTDLLGTDEVLIKFRDLKQ
ncbi:MAG: cysteine hydrolase family protein [Candidatus Hodarchaeales archaeon]|jgi:nicotinamidase-related amidase